MKNLFLLLSIVLLLFACKKEESNKTYPKSLQKVLDHHGGIIPWKKAKTLSYTLKDEDHTIDLHSRKSIITSANYSVGFDGKEVWLWQKKDSLFKKDPKFYYNLFFYFYAMPFVLADDGILYEETTPLQYEGVSYPGIKISYKPNVGTSPDDNYFIYYNPKTYQMEWLGYTVTYFSKQTSTNVKMIRYNKWGDVNGFLLPKEITWYKTNKENGSLESTGKIVTFENALVTEAAMANRFFEKPTE